MDGNSWLWLRSPGSDSGYAMRVIHDGEICDIGDGVIDSDHDGVRTALNLNLSSSNHYSYAGTVCSDGTVTEPGN